MFDASKACEKIMCRNDELSWLFTNTLSATRQMKVKRMGITEILRNICLFSAKKIKSSESFSKQPTQLIIVAHNCHNVIELLITWFHKIPISNIYNSVRWNSKNYDAYVFQTNLLSK